MESLYIWPQYPFLSWLTLLLLTMTFFYLARDPMHRALDSLREGIGAGLGRVGDWSRQLASRLDERNRKVLLESGLIQAGHRIAHELEHLEGSYAKRLAAFPELQLRIEESVTRIERDYQESTSVPPKAPGWGEVVEALARVQESASDRTIKKMLGEIHRSAVEGEKKALEEFRAQAGKRHRVLGTMAPTWQRLEKLMKRVHGLVTSMLETAAKIDRYMKEYEDLRNRGEESTDLLASKTTKLFVFSLIVMIVAAGGAFINFQLIALPMSELVPAGARVVGMSVAEVAALVIVALEVVAGIFLVESLGITGIFPQIANLTRSRRRMITLVALGGLLFLASVEASLAILREQLVEAQISLQQALAGSPAVAEAEGSLIPVLGQATLGFVLPWILAMVAIPLEVLIESSQHVLTKLLGVLILGLGTLSRVTAHLVDGILTLATHLYDAYIVVPGAVAQLVKSRQATKRRAQVAEP